ncbi:MAG: DNA recombination protein RmuC [Pontibacterium sp.]
MDWLPVFFLNMDVTTFATGFMCGCVVVGLLAWGRLQGLRAEQQQQNHAQQLQVQQYTQLEQQYDQQTEALQQLEVAQRAQDERLKQHEIFKARLEERLGSMKQRLEQGELLKQKLSATQAQLADRNESHAELETRLQERTGHLRQLEQRFNSSQLQQEDTRRELATRNEHFAELETRLETERQAHTDKLKALEEARDQLTSEFQNLANKIFDEKAAKFSQVSQEGLGHILNPLRDQLGDFKKRVEDVYDKEAKDRRSLHEQISQLKHLNQQMSDDAVNLTQALKGESKTQGNWGEVILERVLEESGLRRGHEFEVQVSLVRENKRYQPDVIVRLPDQKDVIVDAKVSLTAYEQYCSGEEAERQRLLREHLQSLRNHIKGLGEKSYESLEGVRSLDFVLLFVPIEGAFHLALENDPALFREAFDRNIMLVSPATLLVTLRTIHNIWRYEYQSRNAQDIARRGGELHDKFVGFVESIDDIGRHLSRAQQAYDTAHKRLSSGRGNLVNQAAMLNKLGAGGKKKLPGSLLDAAKEADAEPE